ncbi:MAG: hypothetical protein LBD05_01460, partial [Mycoplasmataceae bacterium]|nr:hypothetical protein [Mycoplasmataceae bacterium]
MLKFSIEKNIFLTALKFALNINDQSSSNFVLSSFKIEIKNENLVIETSNQNNSLKITIGKENITDISSGKILIKAKILYDTINKISNSNVKIEQIDSSILKITSAKFTANINLFDVEAYPIVDFDKNGYKKIIIPLELLKIISNKLISFSEKTMSNISPLNGILFDSTRIDNQIEVVASDYAQLAYIKEKYVGEKFKSIFTIEMIAIIMNMYEQNKDTKVDLYLKEKNVILDNKNILIKCKLIDGDFPSVNKIIDEEQIFFLKFNKKEAIDIIERSIIINANEKKPITQLNFKKNIIEIICSSSEIGKTYDELLLLNNYDGENISVSVNAKNLLNILKNINSSIVTLSFSSKNRPFNFID